MVRCHKAIDAKLLKQPETRDQAEDIGDLPFKTTVLRDLLRVSFPVGPGLLNFLPQQDDSTTVENLYLLGPYQFE